MTIAQQLKIKEFPFEIRNNEGNLVYYEDSNGYWSKQEFDDWGNRVYYEDSDGQIEDNRPQQNCEGKIVEIDGKKYKLKLLK